MPKNYSSATKALAEHLNYLKSVGKYNSAKLAERMKKAKVPEENRMSESLFRQLRLGSHGNISEGRVIAACRVLGIKVTVRNPHIPTRFKSTS